MGIGQEILEEVIRRITRVAPAERIIVFGSAATDEMIPDSDIDLLVIQHEISDPWGERLRIREALRDLAYPFDVILMTKERFEETKDVIGGIAYPATRHGKVIYEAA